MLLDATTESWFDMKRVRLTGYSVQSVCGRRKLFIIRCEERPHCSGQDVCLCIDGGCEESLVLGPGVVSKAADVGFVDGVQERAVTLDQMQQCGLELASGQNSDLLLWRGSGQG